MARASARAPSVCRDVSRGHEGDRSTRQFISKAGTLIGGASEGKTVPSQQHSCTKPATHELEYSVKLEVFMANEYASCACVSSWAEYVALAILVGGEMDVSVL